LTHKLLNTHNDVSASPPIGRQVEETLSTLLYATRTKNIHNRPAVQYDPKEAQISLLRREMELLRQENGLLREQLRAGAAHGVSGPGANSPWPGSPGGGAARAGTPPPPASPRAGGLEDLAAADELVADLRSRSSPLLLMRASGGDGRAAGEQPGVAPRISSTSEQGGWWAAACADQFMLCVCV
jgi:hypothetical protein